jgi:hypothetical protein
MPSTLSTRSERVVQNMVRVAGGEREFEAALAELRETVGPMLTAAQVLDHLLRKRIEQLKEQAELHHAAT